MVTRDLRLPTFALHSVRIFYRREDFGAWLSPAAAGPIIGSRDALETPFPSPDALRLRTTALLCLRLHRVAGFLDNDRESEY